MLTAYLSVYFCGGGEFADVVSLVFHLYPHTSVPAFTTFGWILFHNDWINQSSTHANVESKKPRRLTEA
ncbi:hypothetical protein CEQ36_09360 [Yersinia intermedia]|nr:hypothetical protein A6J67_23380 [Yersinia sp. FDAARGOS_228]AVL35806.1 hypothetical protein CEQ36_09360 [Yersinia intermedia]